MCVCLYIENNVLNNIQKLRHVKFTKHNFCVGFYKKKN